MFKKYLYRFAQLKHSKSKLKINFTHPCLLLHPLWYPNWIPPACDVRPPPGNMYPALPWNDESRGGGRINTLASLCWSAYCRWTNDWTVGRLDRWAWGQVLRPSPERSRQPSDRRWSCCWTQGALGSSDCESDAGLGMR